jgi:hypothetical protein
MAATHGGIAGASNRVTAAGAGMIPATGRNTLRYARETAYGNAAGGIVGATPGHVVFL